ncbi:MAG: energy-coupling factor ABC transporter permease [Deltaproteobacteria bacterium]|nr:energy-coupling factor ABC transporter permease [Deltaproteobacteria bacterium]
MKIIQLAALIGLMFLATPAHAMHLSEGILPMGWAALWYIVALPFVAYGVYKVKAISKEDITIKPMLGMMGAAVFIISCMPVPVPTAGTCSHPCGTGMAAILIGPVLSAFVASIALLIQALFLAHGGITTWGADIVSMGVVGSFSAYLAFKGLRKVGIGLVPAAFIAGIISDWATYATTSFELATALQGKESFLNLFSTIMIAFIPTQLPLGILEGAMTAGMVAFVMKRRPEILERLGVLKVRNAECGMRSVASILLLFALTIAPLKAFAEEAKWAGVDESVVEKVAKEHGREAWTPFINTDQGDLLLFVFLIGGAIGGFVMGYYWRGLFDKKGTVPDLRTKRSEVVESGLSPE